MLKIMAAVMVLAVAGGCATVLRGPRIPKPAPEAVVDRTTMEGKVMAGYQGWFACPGDGAGRGWYHWGRGDQFGPGQCTIDLWPDMTEHDADERYDTAFTHADGSPAQVFSSLNPKTVSRHFRWMKEYGVDGAFVQRFGCEVTVGEVQYRQFTTVLGNAARAANEHGRAYAMTYDLSGMQAGQVALIKDDFNRLVAEGVILGPDDRAYLHHLGRPIISIWGVGFNDDRKYTLAECADLITFFRDHPAGGANGFTVMLGVPTFWRVLRNDAVADPYLHEVIRMADVVWPWMVGRFGTSEQAREMIGNLAPDDMAWCREAGLDYLPVVFPGFSWHNLNPDSPLDAIPRNKGRFLWDQYVTYAKAGATMAYQAMFDEVDEGTAVFKCTNDPPVNGTFLTYEGLPEDHYLWLTGTGGRLLRGEIRASKRPPRRR
jgi:hypothetical protein